MMKRIFRTPPLTVPLAMLATLISVLITPNGALAGICAAQNGARVTVQVMDPRPKLVRSSNLKQINSKAKVHGLLKRGNMVLGLTQSEVGTSMNMKFRGLNQGNVTCLNIDRVEASFGHRNLNILVPREYARASCQYNTVLKHEMEHVRVNREGVRKYAVVLQRELERALASFNPRQVVNIQVGQADAKLVMQRVVRKVTAKFQKEINAQHALIDKPGGAYDASGACRNW